MPDSKKTNIVDINDIKNRVNADKIKKQYYDQGLSVDEENFNQLIGGPVQRSMHHQASYPDLDESEMVDPYSSYISKEKLYSGEYDVDELNKMRAENQSNWDQAGNAVGRLALNIVPQIVGGFASMTDIKGYFDAEHGATNALVNAVDQWKQSTNEMFPIYRENPDKPMDFGDGAWWFESGEGLAESVGSFLAQGYGVGKLVSLGLKGLGGLTNAKKLVSFAGSAKNLKTATRGAETLLNAVALNQAEATIDATQAYNETKQHWLDKGEDEETARKHASIAASSVYNINRANILLNLTSSQAFFQPLRVTRQLLSRPGITTSLKELAKEGSQEAVEELINHAAGQAGRAHGKGEQYGVDDAFRDMKSAQGMEAAFLGAIGGIAQTGGQHIGRHFQKTTDADGNQISVHQDEVNRYNKQQEIIQSMTKEKAANLIQKTLKYEELMKQRDTAALNRDQKQYDDVSNKLLEDAVFEHSQAGTMEVLENMLRSASVVDGAEDMGITPQKIDEVINHVKQLEDIYNNFEGYQNAYDLFMNRASKFRHDQEVDRAKNDLTVTKTKAEQKARELAENPKYTETRVTKRKITERIEGEEVVRRGRKKLSKQTQSIPLSYSFDNLSENPTGNINHEQFVKDLEATPEYQQYQQSLNNYNDGKMFSDALDAQFNDLKSDKTQEIVKKKNEQLMKDKEHNDIIVDSSKNDIAELQNIINTSKNPNIVRKATEKLNSIKSENEARKQKEYDNNVYSQHAHEIASTNEVTALEKKRAIIEADTKLSDDVKTRILNTIDNQINSIVNNDVDTKTDIETIVPKSTVVSETSNKVVDAEKERPNDLPDTNPETQDKQIEQLTRDITKNSEVTFEQDENGHVNYNYPKIENGANKIGNLVRGYSQDKEGSDVTRTDEDTINEEALNFANPDITKEGAEIVFIVDENYKGDVYNPESDEKEKISWSERKKQIPQDQMHLHVPIRIETKDGKFLGYVHSMDWMTDENISGDIDENKQQLESIRKAIMKNHQEGKKTQTKLQSVSPGVLYLSKTAIPVKEAMPDTKLPIGVMTGTGLKGVNLPKVIENIDKCQNGRTYAIIPIGDKMYAVPAKYDKLSTSHIESIVTAVRIFRNGAKTEVEKQLLEKYDLSNAQGLRKYLSHFTYVWSLQGGEQLNDALSKAGLGSDSYAISVDNYGVVLGRGKVSTLVKIKKQGEFNEDSFRKFLGKMFFIPNATHLSDIETNESVLLLDEQGTLRNTTYENVIKESVQTNVRSFNVTPNEPTPKYVYTVQPVAKYDTNFAVVSKKSTEKVGNIEAKKSDIERRRQEELNKLDTLKKEIGDAFSGQSSTNDLLKAIGKFFVENFGWKFEGKRQYPLYVSKERNRTEFDIDGLEVNLPEGSTIGIMGGSHYARFTPQEIVNAKYDAELAALEQQNQTNIAQEISEIAENKNADKRVLQYAEHSLEELESELESYKKNIIKSDEDKQMIEDLTKAIELKKTELPKGPVKFGKGDTAIDIDFSDFDFDSDVDDMLTPEAQEQLKKRIDELSVPGLSAKEQLELISNIASRVMARIVNNHDKGITGVGNNKNASQDVMNEMLENFKEIYKFVAEKNHPAAAKFKSIVENYSTVSKLVEDELNLFATGKVKPSTKKKNIESDEENGGMDELTEDINEDETVGSVENTAFQDDWSLTLDSKSTASANLKRFLAGVMNLTYDEATGTFKPVKNSLSLEQIVPFDTVYNTLHKVLSGLPADYDAMITRLKLYSKTTPWLQSVVEKLENASESVKNEFVSDMTKHGIKMRFIMWQKNPDGTFTLKDMNANSASIEEDIRDEWNTNLISDECPITMPSKDGSDVIFNTEKVKELYELTKEWSSKNPPSPEILRQWLNDLGIVMSDKGFKAILDGKYVNKYKMSYEQLFVNSKSFVKVLTNQLKSIANTKGEQSVDMTNTFANDTSVKALLKIEALYADNVFSNSFNAGPKSIYTYTNNKYVVDRFRELTSFDDNGNPDYSKLFEQLQQNPYSKESLYLKDLLENEDFRREFGVDYLSLDAIKEMFKQSKDDNKLNNLAVDEHEILKLAMFFNATKSFVSNGYKRRLVSFFYPTMSDKTTMMLVNTLAHNVEFDSNGKLADRSIERLFDALVLPEMLRMNKNVSISGYNPNMFYFIPELNDNEEFMTLVNQGNGQSARAIEIAFEIIQSHFDNYVNDKVNDLISLGVGSIVKNDRGGYDAKYAFLNNTYMNDCKGDFAKDEKELGSEGGKLRNAVRDYVYNQLIYNAEMHKLVIGDVAFFYKKPDKSLSTDAPAIDKLQNTFINLGKRLAKEIAPGVTLADSEKNHYYQVFLEDKESNSKILDSLYSKQLEKILAKDVWDKYTQKNKINAADAQEYTTWQEHLYVLKQLGRLSKKQFDKLYGKLKNNQDLTYDELKVVFQPIKPVYTGNVFDEKLNVDRVVYIKSSSFPLLPQLTKGSELENLRLSLEALETEINDKEQRQGDDRVNVRASYQTANKVGSPDKPLMLFNKDGKMKSFEDINLKMDNEAVLKLPRKNFRIQQDVPYKHDKDEINTGTQERKLLFNNILDIKGFNYNGKEVNGQELKNEYDAAWKKLFEYKYSKFRKIMGLDQDIKTEMSISELLQQEIPTSNRRNKKVSELDKIINSNFDSIIEQLVKARINVFYEEGEFKKCD